MTQNKPIAQAAIDCRRSGSRLYNCFLAYEARPRGPRQELSERERDGVCDAFQEVACRAAAGQSMHMPELGAIAARPRHDGPTGREAAPAGPALAQMRAGLQAARI